MSGLPSLPSPMKALQAGLQASLTAGLRAIDGGLENVSFAVEAVHRSLGPIPSTTSGFQDGAPESLISKSIEAIRSQAKRGLPITASGADTIESGIDALLTKKGYTEGLNDREKGLEYFLTALSRLPPDSLAAKDLNHKAISLLYRDLPHPPSTQMGAKYQFRSPDGSGNSPFDADIGRSGTPYSRSASSTRSLPVNELPPPGLVFDALIKRDGFVPHPAGLSGLFFSFATSVIHSVFRTSRTNWNINETSSYVDLGILYGNTEEIMTRIRVKDGRGRILPDVFAESRLSELPPAVGALVIMFNRNHNWIVGKLLQINERGAWTDDIAKLSKPENKARLLKQDEEIFQTARLINSATYANVVLGDFLAGILGTVRDGSGWSLDILSEYREADHTLLERGRGNSCSVEFNTLYRLHPTLSQNDEAYAEKLFKNIFESQGADVDNLTPAEFGFYLARYSQSFDDEGNPIPPPDLSTYAKEQLEQLKDDSIPDDFYRWQNKIPFMERDPETKRYKDDDLAAALLNATAVPAGAFKARGVPKVMRVIEIMGIEQARQWGCCSLNDFRRFLGLKPYATFEEWNPDYPDVAEAARKLYRNIENLELYVGLVAEQAKPVMDGSGLCPSYTMSRAILADAVALVRGDRHYTYDFTPFNLTSWGFTECNRNVNNAGWGGMLGRVISRGLPRHYDSESVYTHFPLITPTGQVNSIGNTLKKLGLVDEYSLERPIKSGETIVVSSFNDIYTAFGPSAALGDTVKTPYLRNIKDVRLSPSFLTVIDDDDGYTSVTKLVQEVFVPKDTIAQTAMWFHDKTIELLREKSFRLAGDKKSRVDLVKDVLRLIPVHWSSTQVASLPLKTTSSPRGIFYEQQIYQLLSEIYSFIYLEADKSLKIPQRAEAKQNVDRLLRFIKLSLQEASGTISASILGTISSMVVGDGAQHSNPILKRLLALESPLDELANDVLAVISTASIELSQIFVHVINFYLPPEKPGKFNPGYKRKLVDYKTKVELQNQIVNVVQSNTPGSTFDLISYVREALRLDPVIPGVYREAVADGSFGPYTYSKGDRLYFDYFAAGRDAVQFPNPLEVVPGRPEPSYSYLHGDGVFKVLGEDFVYQITAAVLKAVFAQRGLTRLEGPTGSLRRFKEPVQIPYDTVTYEVIPATDPESESDADNTGLEIYDLDVGEVRVAAPPKIDGPRPKRAAPGDRKLYHYSDGDGNRAMRYVYTDPDNSYRITTWATGLVVAYDS